ncbi:ABC transporter permease [Paenibacillus mucilaginosus]|nr:ABC transporter permease [Paenibacillus mucilaginosus]
MRLDLGSKPQEITIKDIKYSTFFGNYSVSLSELNAIDSNHLSDISKGINGLQINTIGSDPFIVLPIDEAVLTKVKNDNQKKERFLSLILAVVCAFFSTLLNIRRKLLLGYVRELVVQRDLIFNLSKNDFKTRYAGSYLGIFWAFVQPIFTILVYWFVFEIGFRSGPVNNVPFVLWFMAGMIPWFFFSEALTNATYSFLEYSYLVKKVVFQIKVLPLVKVVSALFIHIFFVLFIIIIYAAFSYYPTIHFIQLVYYSFCIFMLVVCLSFITSALIVFLKDVGQILNLVLQFGMWLTPILWSYQMIPQSYQWLLKLNPMYYIVEGYRDSLINGVWFWERFNQTVYFWSLVVLIMIIGSFIYRKLKPHFADVL